MTGPAAVPDGRDPRDRNNERAFAAGAAWAAAHGQAAQPVLDRLAFAILTESYGGYNLANDGSAYTAERNPTFDDLTRTRVQAVLRRSLDLPHDIPPKPLRPYSDGRSTGILQQISRDAVLALHPDENWGWGTLEDTLDPERAAGMFCAALRITNTAEYRTPLGLRIDAKSPIIADVLRTQRPSTPTAVLPAVYQPPKLAQALRMVNGGPRFWTDGGN